MKLRKVKWQNHPVLGNLELDFTRDDGTAYDTVILIGENDSGKTSVMESIGTFLNVGSFDEFEYSVAKNAVERFFWDEYCDNYLEIVKSRAYADDLSALASLRVMTEAFLLLFAPYVSHLTSAVYREIFHKEVHKCGSFVELFAIDFTDKQAVADMKIGLEIIYFVRQKKAEMKVSIKVPIKKLVVPAMPKAIEDDIKAMLSVESVEVGEEMEIGL